MNVLFTFPWKHPKYSHKTQLKQTCDHLGIDYPLTANKQVLRNKLSHLDLAVTKTYGTIAIQHYQTYYIQLYTTEWRSIKQVFWRNRLYPLSVYKMKDSKNRIITCCYNHATNTWTQIVNKVEGLIYNSTYMNDLNIIRHTIQHLHCYHVFNICYQLWSNHWTIDEPRIPL